MKILKTIALIPAVFAFATTAQAAPHIDMPLDKITYAKIAEYDHEKERLGGGTIVGEYDFRNDAAQVQCDICYTSEKSNDRNSPITLTFKKPNGDDGAWTSFRYTDNTSIIFSFYNDNSDPCPDTTTLVPCGFVKFQTESPHDNETYNYPRCTCYCLNHKPHKSHH